MDVVEIQVFDQVCFVVDVFLCYCIVDIEWFYESVCDECIGVNCFEGIMINLF